MWSSQVSSGKVVAGRAPVSGVLLAKPLSSRSVLVRFKEDERDGNKVVNQVQNKAQDLADKVSKSLPDSSAEAPKGQNVMRSGSAFDSQVQTNWALAAFTRRREVFTGRLAMVGFFAACYWEWYFPSRPNILQQLSAFTAKTGFQLSEATLLTVVLGLVVYNALSALAPGSPTLSEENQRDVAKRPPGPTQEAPSSLQQFLGIRGWGFNKANELFVGRTAMIGFAAALLGQLRQGGLQGPGPLAQVANIIGQTPDDAWYAGAGNFFVLFVIFAIGASFVRGQFGTTQGEEDIY